MKEQSKRVNQEEWTLVERVTICNKPKNNKKPNSRTKPKNRKKKKSKKKIQKKIVMLKTNKKNIWRWKNSVFWVFFLGLNWRKMVLWLKDINHYSKFQKKLNKIWLKTITALLRRILRKTEFVNACTRALIYIMLLKHYYTLKEGFFVLFEWALACLARHARASVKFCCWRRARDRCCRLAVWRVLRRLYKTCPPVIDLRLWGKIVFS